MDPSVHSGGSEIHMAAPPGSVWPTSWRALWAFTNRPRPFEPRAVRLACSILLLAYCAIAVVRHDPSQPWLFLARAVVCAYAGAGVLAAPSLTWRGLRTYLAGLGFLLPAASWAVANASGDHLSDMQLTALVTFIPLAFMVSGTDLVVVGGGLFLLHASLLVLTPPTDAPLATATVLLLGSTVAGAIFGLVMIVTRAGLRDSTIWWQRVSERERLLREFAEVTARSLRSEGMLDGFAERMLAAFGSGRCAIVLNDHDECMRVVATAGFEPARAEAIAAARFGDLLVPKVRALIEHGAPVVRERLDGAERHAMEERWGGAIDAGSFVALPLMIKDVAAGIVVLSAPEPRTFAEADVRLWEAMAHQIGVALANRRLFERLETALQAKSEFLNTMSHELRSPLHVIIGYAGMLLETESEQGLCDTVERMRGSAFELLRLVEESMAAARLEGSSITLRAEEFSLADLATEIAENVRALPEAKRSAPVTWQAAPDLSTARLDRLKVKEIVQNLVSNALKFSPDGGVCVRFGRTSDAVQIAVEDRGPGIPEEAQARIFEMFERLESPNGTRVPGVGLGLYIVRQLVQLMGGTIQLESRPREGARFTVHLPLTLDTAA
jgi:signal transduction histidine kinase